MHQHRLFVLFPGAFAHIPDAGMVGTVFCNAVSNALVIAHFNCSLVITVHGVRDALLLQCRVAAHGNSLDVMDFQVSLWRLLTKANQNATFACRESLISLAIQKRN